MRSRSLRVVCTLLALGAGRLPDIEKLQPDGPHRRRSDSRREHLGPGAPRAGTGVQVQGKRAADPAGRAERDHQRRPPADLHLRGRQRFGLHHQGLRPVRRRARRSDNKTSVQIDRLEIGRAYYWRAWAQDGANTGAIATAGFEIFPKPAVTAPGPVSPINNEVVGSTTPTLRRQQRDVRRSGRRTGLRIPGRERPGVLAAGDRRHRQPGRRADDVQQHAAAQQRVASSGARAPATARPRASWSATQAFRTPAAPAPAPAGPTPPQRRTVRVEQPAESSSAIAAKFGHMSSSQTVTFLQSSARSLTAQRHRRRAVRTCCAKSGGSSCNGFSCDIICSGNGNSQRQWDVLGDAEGGADAGMERPEHGAEHPRGRLRHSVSQVRPAFNPASRLVTGDRLPVTSLEAERAPPPIWKPPTVRFSVAPGILAEPQL